MKDYNKIEKCLKSFIKNNKRLSYSVALLITFLINGGFSYADEAVQIPLRTEIKTRIEKEQANISKMLKETDASMKDIELRIKKLTQRGTFWVKPLEKSNQVFFFVNWGNYSRNRNRNESNFTGPEYSASSGRNMGYGQYINGKYYGEYGVIKNLLEFVDKIDFGANITPKSVTEKTVTAPSVTQKPVTTPTVSIQSAPSISVKASSPEAPNVGLPQTPTAPTIAVNAPRAITPLGSISVTKVDPVNVSVEVPNPPAPPTISAPTVTPPGTPAGFEPRTISPPSISPISLTIPDSVIPPSIVVTYQDVPNNSTGWYNDGKGVTGNNGLISQLDLTKGTFNMFFKGHGNQQEHSFTGAVDTANTLPSDYVGVIPKVAFYGIGGKSSATIGANVTINSIGNYLSGAYNSIFYIGHNNSGSTSADSRLTNYGTVNIYGNNILIVNSDNVSSATGKTMSFVNEGTITSFTETKEFSSGKVSGTSSNIVFGGFTYGSPGNEHIENGISGKVILNSSNSAAWMYSPASSSNVKRSAINNGVIELKGKGSIGIGTNTRTREEDMAYADIQLNTPIQILGDKSAGANILTQPNNNSTNFENSLWNIEVGSKESIGLNFDFKQNNPTLNNKTIKNIELP